MAKHNGAAGPKEKLDSTVISQPAIYVASLAALEKLRQDSGEVSLHVKSTLKCSLAHGNGPACTLPEQADHLYSRTWSHITGTSYDLSGPDFLCPSRRSSARLMWQLGSAWASTQHSPLRELSSVSLSSGSSI